MVVDLGERDPDIGAEDRPERDVERGLRFAQHRDVACREGPVGYHHDPGRATKPARSSIASPAFSTPCSSQRLADDLQAQRQAVLVEPARHRHRRQAREARRHGEHVVEVHRQRIGRLLAQRERRRRRGRGQERVALLEARSKSRAISVRTFCACSVIGVVEARRQHIGADHDPPLHLGAEARGPRRGIHVLQPRALRHRAGRSARRHSARGSTTPRPAR